MPSKKNYGSISISKLQDGKNALSVNINAPTQFFKSSNGVNYSPTNIVLTPIFQGGATFKKWQFSLNGDNNWTDVISSTNGVTIGSVGGVQNCLTIQNTSTLFNTSASTVSFRVTIMESETIYDVMTLAKITDGVSGTNGYNSAVIYLYKASATPISQIDWDSSIIYYFDTNRLSFTPDGWSRDIPESDNPIYMTAATAYSNSMSYAIPTNIWTTPIQYVRNGKDGVDGTDGKDGQDGEDGKSIKRVDEYYVVSEKSTGVTIENTTGWGTSIPDFTNTKRYLWNYSVTVLSDDSELQATTPKVIGTKGIDGTNGEDGTDGAGIASIQNYYLVSPNNTGITNNELAHGWQTTPPTMTRINKYLWNFEKITLDDEQSTVIKTDAMIIGAYGDTGAAGQDGSDGEDGRSVSSVTEEFYLSNSYETLEGGSWTSNRVTWVKGKFIWTRSVIKYSDNSQETTSGICVTGLGVVDNVDVMYCLSTSATVAPDAEDDWTTEYPGWVEGKYLWSKTITSYSDGRADSETAPVCISGSKGSTGVGIVNVVEMFLATASNSNVTTDTIGWSEDPTTQTMTPSKRYLWNYEITHYSDSHSENTVPKIIGVYGDQGATGQDGVSITAVKHKYLATSETVVTKETEGWTETIQTMTKDKKFLWNYEIIQYSNGSNSESDPVIIGAFGVDGNSITGVVEQYAMTDSPTVSPSSGQWSTVRPDYDPFRYLWTRSIINYSDKSSDYTSPICVTGPSATSISMDCSAYAISKNKNNIFNPASITVTGKIQRGSDPIENYSCRFRIEESTNGTSWTKKYESSEDEESYTYNMSGSNVVSIRCSMYKEGGFTTLLDQQVIPIVSDGVDGQDGADGTNGKDGIDGEDGVAYTVILTNEAHSFSAGTEYAYNSSASTKVIALKNSDPVSVNITKINNTAVSSSPINIVSGLSASITGNDTTDCTITFTATTSLKTKSGVVPIEMTIDGNTVIKEFSYSLAISGERGSDSTSYSMIMSSYVIAKKADGTLDTTSIKLVAKSCEGSSAPTNYNARFIIEKCSDDTMESWEPVYTSSVDENQCTYNPTTDVKGLRCSMYLAGGTTNLLDQQIVPVVSDGSDGADGKDGADGQDGADGTGYTIVLSNESHSFAAGEEFATGGVAETKVIAYKNATKVSANVTKINDIAVSGSSSFGIGITGLKAMVTSNNSNNTTIRFTADTSLNTVQGSVPITIRVDGKEFTKNFSFSLSLTGAAGEDGTSIESVDVWYCISDSNTQAPSEGWSTDAPQWVNGKYIWSKTITTYSDPLKEATETDPVCISGSNGSNGKDGISFVGITEYYLATSISESSSLPEVGSTAWKTTIQQITPTNRYLWNYEVTEFSNGDKSDPTTPKIIGVYGQKGDTGNDGVSITGIITYYYATTQSSGITREDPDIDWDTDASAQKIDSTKRYLWKYDEVSYSDNSKSYTEAYLAGVYGDKGDNGINGINTATIYLYKRSVDVPTKPTTTSTYTFTSKTITGTDIGTGKWETTIPSGTDPVYITIATASSNSATDSIASSEWSAPTILAKNGEDGLKGYSTAIVYLYRRSSTIPTIDWINSLTYNFSQKQITSSAPENWSKTIPSGTEPLYITMATAFSNQNTVSLPSSSWSAPVLWVQNGADGTDGKNGINSATVYLYKRSASKPSLPTGNLVYTFSDGDITEASSGALNGWSSLIPSGTNPIYVTFATASSTGVSDTITTSEWTDPVIMAQNGTDGKDGSNGATGYNNAVIQLYKRSQTAATIDWSQNMTYTFATNSLTNIPSGWSRQIPSGNSSYPLYVTAATAYANTTTKVIKSTEWSTPVKLVQNGTNGLNGVNVATVYLYRRSSSTISTGPSTNVTYTFSTGKATGTEISQTGATGLWSTVVPSGTEDLYVVTATAVATQPNNTDTIEAGEWSTPTILAKNGTNGVNGYNSAIIYLYKRAKESSAPASGPTTTSTYTFASKTITGTDIGTGKWETTIPSGTDPVYIVAATAMSRSTTDTIDANDWSDPVIMSKNGTNGTNGSNGADGADGYNVATVYLYTRASSTPSKPSSNVTYTFSTGVASGNDIGSSKTWKTTIPSGSSPIYVTMATAISKSNTYTITSNKWSSPVKLAQDGTPSTTVLLSNECYTFVADSEGKGIAGSIKSDVYGYVGTTRAVVTIGKATNVPTGMTVTPYNSGSAQTLSYFTVSITDEMTTLSGYVEIPISCNGITFNKKFSYSLSKEGDPGRNFIIEPSTNIISRKITKTQLEEGGIESTIITISPKSVTFNFYERIGLEETMNAIECNYTLATSTNGTTFTDKSSSRGTSCTYTISKSEYDPEPDSSGNTADPIKAIRCTIKSLTDTSIVLARIIVAVVDEVNNEYIEEEFQNVYAEIDKWSLEASSVSAEISKDVTNAQYRLENLMATIEGGSIYEFDDEGNLVLDEEGHPVISESGLKGLNDTFQESIREINTNLTELRSEGQSIQATVSDFTSKLVDTKVQVLDENGNTIEVPAYESFVRTAQQIIEATSWQTRFMEGQIETASMIFDAQHGLTIKTSEASGEENEDKYETVITGTDFSCYYNKDYVNPVFHISKDEVQTSRLKVNNGIDLTNLKIVNCSQSSGNKNVIGVDFVQSISAVTEN